MENRKTKSILSGVITLAVMILVLMSIFRGQGKDILQCLRTVPVYGLVWLFMLAFCCSLLEAFAVWLALHAQMPEITFGQALTACYLNIFGNVATMGAGSIPLQSWYLSLHGMLPGVGAGLVTLCYAMQKLTALLYATVMLIFQGGWLYDSNQSVSHYIFLGYLVCAFIILALVLICTWGKVQELLLWGIGKLPETEKWVKRKVVWSENVEGLRKQSKALLTNHRCCAEMILLYALKHGLLYAISYRSITLLGLDQLSFWRVQLLSAVMLLITNALPNIGGVGPAEFAFTLIYAPYLGNANAASAMILYRIASYLFPFLVSVPFVLHFRRLVHRQGSC